MIFSVKEALGKGQFMPLLGTQLSCSVALTFFFEKRLN